MSSSDESEHALRASRKNRNFPSQAQKIRLAQENLDSSSSLVPPQPLPPPHPPSTENPFPFFIRSSTTTPTRLQRAGTGQYKLEIEEGTNKLRFELIEDTKEGDVEDRADKTKAAEEARTTAEFTDSSSGEEEESGTVVDYTSSSDFLESTSSKEEGGYAASGDGSHSGSGDNDSSESEDDWSDGSK